MPELLPNIKSLDIRQVMGHRLDTLLNSVSRCPELEQLQIEDEFTRRESDFSFITLRDLRLVENEMVDILVSCLEQTNLTIRRERFNQHAYKALKRHFPTLKVLNLYSVHGLKSWMCGSILTQCPHLVELVWADLDVDAIVSSEDPAVDTPVKKRRSMADSEVSETRGLPWACKYLKMFKAVSIRWSIACDAFLHRLAQFEQLEKFLIGGGMISFGIVGTIGHRLLLESSPRRKKHTLDLLTSIHTS